MLSLVLTVLRSGRAGCSLYNKQAKQNYNITTGIVGVLMSQMMSEDIWSSERRVSAAVLALMSGPNTAGCMCESRRANGQTVADINSIHRKI